MPGEALRSYDAADVTGTLPAGLEVVLTAAAQVIGVDTQAVSDIVEQFERRMEARRPRRGETTLNNPAIRRLRGPREPRDRYSLA